MDWGLHDNFQVFNYALLPNAPAADRAHRERWEIDTVVRDVPKEGTGQRHRDDTDALTRVPIVVGSKTFSRDDWVRMRVYTAFVRALHNFGLTRFVAMYLHFGHAVTYRQIYDALVEEHFSRTWMHDTLVRHLGTFLIDPDATEDLAFERFAERPLSLEPSRWVFVQIALDIDRQFDALTTFLTGCFPAAVNLRSAIDFQRRILVLPGAAEAQGAFRPEHDWIAYFERASRLTTYEPLGEPDRSPGAAIVTGPAGSDTARRQGHERQRWLAWLEQSHEVRRVLGGGLPERGRQGRLG
jgi:hypothetical protein